jgi:hypothetical protein
VRLDDIEDVDLYLEGVVRGIDHDPCDHEVMLEVGTEELVKMFKALQPGDSLRRTAAGMIEKRIISGMRKEWSYRSRVTSLDSLEAEPDGDYVSDFRAVATYGPEIDDAIDSADALAAFESEGDFQDPHLVGRLINGTPSHRPAPPMRSHELEEARRHELRLIGRRFPYLKSL